MSESAWDEPRPPRAEPTSKLVCVECGEETSVEARRACRVLESSHPPVFSLPPADARRDLPARSARSSYREWKERVVSYTLNVGGRRVADVAWSYSEPTAGFEAIRDDPAFDPSRVNACFVDGEWVRAREGGGIFMAAGSPGRSSGRSRGGRGRAAGEGAAPRFGLTVRHRAGMLGGLGRRRSHRRPVEESTR